MCELKTEKIALVKRDTIIVDAGMDEGRVSTILIFVQVAVVVSKALAFVSELEGYRTRMKCEVRIVRYFPTDT